MPRRKYTTVDSQPEISIAKAAESPTSIFETRSQIAESPFALNKDEFWHMLNDFDLSDEQKGELLSCLWNVMYTFAAMSLSQDSHQFTTSADMKQ